jgi:hypothetical protein
MWCFEVACDSLTCERNLPYQDPVDDDDDDGQMMMMMILVTTIIYNKHCFYVSLRSQTPPTSVAKHPNKGSDSDFCYAAVNPPLEDGESDCGLGLGLSQRDF